MDGKPFSFIADEIAASPALAALLTAYSGGSFPLEVAGAENGLRAFIIAAFATNGRPPLVVAPTEHDAEEITADLRALGAGAALFPGWGTIPYRCPAPSSPVWSERARILSELAAWEQTFPMVTSQRTLMSPLPPPEYTAKQRVLIEAGEALDTPALAARLSGWGYARVQRVQSGGEFAVRGEVVDVMPQAGEDAYRITLDFDRVESIRRFDAAQQTSQSDRLGALGLCPLKEVVWDDERIDCLSANVERLPEFSGKNMAASGGLIDLLITRGRSDDEALFFPLAFDKPASLLDYCGEAPVIFLEWERLANAQTALDREYAGLFRNAFRERPVPAPERLLYNFEALTKNVARRVSFLAIKKSTLPDEAPPPESDGGAARTFTVNCDPPRSFFGNINYMKDEFAVLLAQGWRVAVAAESNIQVLRISELLKDLIDRIAVIQIRLSHGFALPEIKLLVVQEKEIFGFRRRPPRSLQTARSAAIDTFVDLNPGDFVVHINYGIGLFKGIERINALGNERDYIKLEFADEETVFVPIEQVNLVQRYIGSEGSPPRLDKIGSKGWSERKARAKKAAEELAARLIDLYSKRRAARGFAFPPDGEWQALFEANFAFEETEDQARCVEEIKADMESIVPMDRLVCGDVGYGKTEVAVRACFKAVMSGKQAAFLAPTTILAEQHYENFIERFRDFPVRAAMLSRLVDRKTARDVLDGLRNGEIDILVGTHRIIQKDIVFKDLGLMVIDEEQRFGVKDKERLKELKHNVDCLSLSATPIPRTLHMSLLKIRDMSVLATPPRNRRPIETFIDEYDEEKIAKAVRFETERGGQVFYLHNRIESLDEVKARLARLVPEISIETAHGRLDAEELENVMHRFIHGGFHVL
ncbi:MAG: DEAD/DEAH box helicase, partial [Spirochaetaceae bacterium]|nr:DEAD/DEAH box helicase [Spirochaetaceae bacterium]